MYDKKETVSRDRRRCWQARRDLVGSRWIGVPVHRVGRVTQTGGRYTSMKGGITFNLQGYIRWEI